MKNFFVYFFICYIFFLHACNLNSGTDDYYMQQSDSDDDTSGTVSEDIYITASEVFETIQSQGVVNSAWFDEIENCIKNNDGEGSQELLLFRIQKNQLPNYNNSINRLDFNSLNLHTSAVRFSNDASNFMTLYYDSTYSWISSSDTTYLLTENNSENLYTFESHGSDLGTGSYDRMSEVVYYKYVGYNPFFTIESNYNQATFGKNNSRVMERFIFYRFTAKGGGVMDVNTMLVALDTYTGLLFPYAIATEFLNLEFLGIPSVPTRWESLEDALPAIEGKKYLFFEYDPIGYIDVNGEFKMYDWYLASQENLELYTPTLTKTSPYLIASDLAQNEN